MVVQPNISLEFRNSHWSRRPQAPQAGGQMAADTDHPSIPAMRLAERLRRLREQEHLTQKQLARALGGSITAVSMWEKPGSDRLPPPTRLAAYARLFCTSRSFSSGAPRLLRDDELTAHDQEQEAVLYDELMALRERASSTASAAEPTALPSAWRHGSIWNFRSGTAVSIVDSVAPDPPPYASQAHLHYSQYARFADLDALIEIFAQVKADNPSKHDKIFIARRTHPRFCPEPSSDRRWCSMA